jgi:hypothetical protein
MIPGEELLFLALGGSGEIGMNVNLYGCRGLTATRTISALCRTSPRS